MTESKPRGVKKQNKTKPKKAKPEKELGYTISQDGRTLTVHQGYMVKMMTVSRGVSMMVTDEETIFTASPGTVKSLAKKVVKTSPV